MTPAKKKIEAAFTGIEIKLPEAASTPQISGFSMPMLPVWLDDATQIKLARWKLIPEWVENENAAKKYANTLNATCETLFSKRSYAPYAMSTGLLLLQGFYEPHLNKDGSKSQYLIQRKDAAIMCVGIIYNYWTDKSSGECIPTFALITTPANELLSEIHNEQQRMPLIIPPGMEQQWLCASSKTAIERLMQPYPNQDLAAERVANFMGGRATKLDAQGKLF